MSDSCCFRALTGPQVRQCNGRIGRITCDVCARQIAWPSSIIRALEQKTKNQSIANLNEWHNRTATITSCCCAIMTYKTQEQAEQCQAKGEATSQKSIAGPIVRLLSHSANCLFWQNAFPVSMRCCLAREMVDGDQGLVAFPHIAKYVLRVAGSIR